MTIIFDIETIALPEAEIRASLPPFNPDKVTLGNASKPETVERIIETARETYGDDIVKRGALDPRYGRVAIAGMLTACVGEDDGKCSQHYQDDECALLECVWNELCATTADIIGFNIKLFDLPFLVKRSWIHSIPVPYSVFNPGRAKYPWDDRVKDLLEVVRCGDYGAKTGGLDAVLKMFDIEGKTHNGSEFGDLWARDREEALAYNFADLQKEQELARRVGL